MLVLDSVCPQIQLAPITTHMKGLIHSFLTQVQTIAMSTRSYTSRADNALCTLHGEVLCHTSWQLYYCGTPLCSIPCMKHIRCFQPPCCLLQVPLTSANPKLDDLLVHKRRIVVLNKADLADASSNQVSQCVDCII